MTNSYTYNPDAWHPAVAGVVAGAIAAIVAGVLSAILRSPDEIVANSLSVVIASLVLGLVAGLLWRRLRATSNARVVFGWTMAGGFIAAMFGIAVVDQTTLSNLIPYATPIAALIFITLGFLTPLLAGATAPVWIAAIPVVVALGIGVGLFGRGNVASGELTLDDLETSPTSTTSASTLTTSPDESTPTSTTSAVSGVLTIPDDLADTYTVTSGVATYSVEEQLQGLAAQGVGTTESISGSFSPTGTFEFTLDLQSFTSDQSRRDGRVRGWFAEFPTGMFSGSTSTLPSTATVGEVVTFDVAGDMTVNGISQPVSWDVEARVETDGTLSVTGETFIVLTDFAVPIVTEGFVQMEDGATLEILFSASPN